MNKKHVSHLVDDYIDGNLGAEDRRKVELHVKECSQCKQELSDLQAVVHDLNRLPKSIVPPEELRKAIERKMLQHGTDHHSRKAKSESLLHFPMAVRFAAGIIIAVGIGMVIWFSSDKPADKGNDTAQRVGILSPDSSRTDASANSLQAKNIIKNNNANTYIKNTAPETAQNNTVPQVTDTASQQTIAVKNPSLAASDTVHQQVTIAQHSNNGCLIGKVIDATTGEGLAGANIVVDNTSLGACSDLDGKFKIMNVPSGRYSITVSYIGYGSEKIADILSSPNSSKSMDIHMKAQSIAANECVVITGQARGQLSAVNQQFSSNTVVQKRIGELPDANAAESIGRLPGVASSNFNTEAYDKINENEFLDALGNPLSTFSIDVDAASYSNVRRFLNEGHMPPPDAVRIEEFVNYFSYSYPDPVGEYPFSFTTEVTASPWNHEHSLLLIGIQGKRVSTEKLPPSNLVFLLDVSGSMDDPQKLPLVKSAFRLLVNQLRPIDKVAIVVYAGSSGLALESTPGNEKEKILDAIDNLEAGGSTAGGAGIKLAYKVAKENFLENGNNRVILATDGDFNIGASSDADMVNLIEGYRNDGIYLSVLGFGQGNYKDSKMEKLADKGNGNCSYIDNIMEAKKVFVEQMAGTLFTIAKDVKIQIEFNPTKVKAYRLIGYENRMLAKEDFNNDRKDAGELGAGHTVTALYEIIPADANVSLPNVDSLKYQNVNVRANSRTSNELLTLKFRYKPPKDDVSKLIVTVVQDRKDNKKEMSENMGFASAVAEWGMLLRDSKFKGSSTFDDVLQRARKNRGEDEKGDRIEFIRLVELSKSLPK